MNFVKFAKQLWCCKITKTIFKEITIKIIYLYYRNPVTSNATISFNATGKYIITITNIIGKILQTKTGISNDDHNNVVRLDVKDYASGMYWVIINDQKGNIQTLNLNKQ